MNVNISNIRKAVLFTAAASSLLLTLTTYAADKPQLIPAAKDDYRNQIRVEVDNKKPAHWAGHDANLSAGKKWYRGQLPILRNGKATTPVLTQTADTDEATEQSTSVMVYEPKTNSLYEEAMPAGGHDALVAMAEHRALVRQQMAP